MKKLLTLTALLGATALSFGQGSVNFGNGVSAITHVSTNATLGGAASGGGKIAGSVGSYYFALFVADSTVTSAGTAGIYGALDPTLTPGWVQVANTYGTNTGVVGRFNGNPDSNDVIIAGRATGSSASFIVVGWSSSVAGADWAAAKTWIDLAQASGTAPTLGWTGASAVATSVQLGGGLTPIGTIFGSAAGQVAGPLLQVQNVPEPTSFALAGLGAAALLIFRRRK